MVRIEIAQTILLGLILLVNFRMLLLDSRSLWRVRKAVRDTIKKLRN